ILRQGRNVGSWAPGELADLVAAGALTLPVDRYVYWYRELPEKLRAQLEEAWGPPPGKIMVFGDSFVFPGALLGNVFLGPQPVRGWADDPEKIKHDPKLPPTHQYLAFYLWLQKEFKADSVVHLGTHGTLEWLPGRSVGLGSDDWPDLLLGDLPDVYPYIVNNPGEGTQAKRRGYAVTIDHLTPPMIKPELYGDLAELSRLAGEARDVLQTGDQTRAAALRGEILKKIDALHLAPELDFDPRAADLRTLAEGLEEYLEGLTRELMPYGLHTFGQPPPGELLDLFARAIVDYDPSTREAIYEEIRQRLLRTTDEMTNLLRALRGEYVPPGLGRDPVRVPDALPTGRNLVSFDPRMVPDPVVWRVGAQVADELVEDYYQAHGTYPEAVGVVLWAIETMRTGGETVAMILRLIGTEPVWDSAGRVTQVKVTPLEELGRPRIDVVVTISGLFRDTFSHVVGVLDQAFRLVAERDEPDNFVRQHYLSLLNELQQAGVPAEQAAALAGARIFGEPPGTYGTGVAELVKATTAWEDTRDLVETYMNRMSYVYGQDTFGEPAREAFAALLRRVEAVVQVRDSLYGVLDNDDVFQYLGGLKRAAEAESGRTVD
ncbi:MAG: cobaltochelatase subunit CobN, partial [Firmicutes bacterium]|nr:cobaltochelatase subunit CobN [Bacillota bacterium]